MFRHQPLDDAKRQIRLVKSLPRPISTEPEEAIYAIEKFEITSSPPYYALSYCWGPPTPANSIAIDGDDARMVVRDNLFQCLQVLQSYAVYSGFYFWIDQICIDQDNMPERNAQVQQMGSIYSKAQEVIAWLGEGDEDAHEAMEAIGSGNAFNVTPEEAKRTTRKLLTNPYWGRLWVAQEILLAKQITLLCRARQLSWAVWSDFWPPLTYDVHVPYLFALGKLFYRGASNDDFKASNAAQTFTRLRRNSNMLRLLPLWNHLASFSISKCKEPRDKVFGLLGFVGDKGQIEVDYAKPVVEIYVDAINVSLDTSPRISLSGGVDPEFYAEILCLGIEMGVLTTAEHVVSVANYFGRGLGRLLTTFGIKKALGVEPTGISEFAGDCLGHLHRLHGVLAEGDIATILKSVGTLQGKLR